MVKKSTPVSAPNTLSEVLKAPIKSSRDFIPPRSQTMKIRVKGKDKNKSDIARYSPIYSFLMA